MKRSTSVTLVIIIFLLILGGLVYSYFKFFAGGKTVGETIDTFKSFFPFGSKDANLQDDNDELRNPEEVDQSELPMLRKISTEPVAGFTTYVATTTVSTSLSTSTKPKVITKNYFRFVMRADGHIFDMAEDAGAPVRISNTTIPRLQEAKFLTSDRLVLRYLQDDNETIATYFAAIKKDISGKPNSIDGIYLPENILDLAVSPLGNIFYLQKSPNGSVGTKLDIKTNKSERIFASPLWEWTFSWPTENKLLYYTKASSELPGILFSLDSKSGRSDKLAGPAVSLTARADRNFNVFYSEKTINKLFLKRLNATDGTFSDTGFSALPEKCVFATAATYCASLNSAITGNEPDLWYQGKTFFSDNIWKLDDDGEGITLISDLKEQSNEDIDAVDLVLSTDGKFLLFKNKRNDTLWSLRLIKEVVSTTTSTTR